MLSYGSNNAQMEIHISVSTLTGIIGTLYYFVKRVIVKANAHVNSHWYYKSKTNNLAFNKRNLPLAQKKLKAGTFLRKS